MAVASEINPRKPGFYKSSGKPVPPSKGRQPWKKEWGKIWDGTTVYIVDGTYVRDHYDVDFVMGGHGYVYATYIPKNEIWLENMVRSEDDALDLAHEIIEYILMKYKVISGYDPAHGATAQIEGLCRKTIQGLPRPPKEKK